jgi:hypothetical protein
MKRLKKALTAAVLVKAKLRIGASGLIALEQSHLECI